MLAQYYHSITDEKEAMEALDRVGLADRAKHLQASSQVESSREYA